MASLDDVSVICDVAVGGQYINSRYPVGKVDIDQGAGNHEVAYITIPAPSKVVPWHESTPVTITYGERKPDALETFYGYINHVEYLSNGKAELWCVGASMPLKTEHMRTFNKVTASYIAKKIAVENGLHIFVDDTDRLITVAQSGESDFEFLKRLAEYSGYLFTVRGTTIYFINPLKPLRYVQQALRWFWLQPEQFKAIVGELAPAGGKLATRISYGVDAQTGRIIAAKDQYERFMAYGDSKAMSRPLIQKYSTDVTASNTKDLMRSLNAEVLRNKHWVQATVMLSSAAYLTHPGSVIELRGNIAPSFLGLWLVNKISHKMEWGYTGWSYEASAELSRDQIYTETSVAASGWSRQSGLGTLFKNGRWVSNRAGL